LKFNDLLGANIALYFAANDCGTTAYITFDSRVLTNESTLFTADIAFHLTIDLDRSIDLDISVYRRAFAYYAVDLILFIHQSSLSLK
jgi:hypothetical protein